MSEDDVFSNIKGDIPFEVLTFDNQMTVKIDYLKDKDCEVTNYNGRFTSKYRRITLIGKLGILSEKIEENPYYDEEADKLNDKWQKSNTEEETFGSSLEIIDEGLSLEEIKERVSNNQSYLVIIWKKGNAPLPVDLGYHRDITLSVIDNVQTKAELVFTVINIVRSTPRK